MSEPTVGDLMTTPVLTVAPDDHVIEVAGAMREQDVNSVVLISDECRPLGILTSTDYVAMTAEGVNPHDTPVEAFATTDVVTTTPDESITVAAAQMADGDISHLPVVTADGEVTGILTTTDLAVHVAG